MESVAFADFKGISSSLTPFCLKIFVNISSKSLMKPIINYFLFEIFFMIFFKTTGIGRGISFAGAVSPIEEMLV